MSEAWITSGHALAADGADWPRSTSFSPKRWVVTLQRKALRGELGEASSQAL